MEGRAVSSVYARRVLITGGTGFIGSALAERLMHLGVAVSVLTRDRSRAEQHFEGRVQAYEAMSQIEGGDEPDVIVNLAGKGLESERWNARVKREIVLSRVETTNHVLDYIARSKQKHPRLLISGSAVGYYGARGDVRLTENDPPANEFQSTLCKEWEAAALRAEDYGVRVCLSRTGVVMGPNGGMLAGLVPMFRLGLGAVAGNGEQWLSWIHMDDLIDIFLRFMADERLSGPFNNTSPEPVTNREFAQTLGQVLHRPVFLRAPAWALRLLKGEMAHLYVTGQRVIPARHLDQGHVFRYPALRSALEHVFSEQGEPVPG